MQTFDINLVVNSSASVESIAEQFYERFSGLVARFADQLSVRVYWESTDGFIAVKKAVCTLEQTLPIKVVRIDPDLVDIPEIASRVDLTRQAVQKWVTDKSHSSHFPVPIGSPGGKRIWSWGQVSEWLRSNRPDLADEEFSLSLDETDLANAWLVERRGLHTELLEWQQPGVPTLRIVGNVVQVGRAAAVINSKVLT